MSDIRLIIILHHNVLLSFVEKGIEALKKWVVAFAADEDNAVRAFIVQLLIWQRFDLPDVEGLLRGLARSLLAPTGNESEVFGLLVLKQLYYNRDMFLELLHPKHDTHLTRLNVPALRYIFECVLREQLMSLAIRRSRSSDSPRRLSTKLGSSGPSQAANDGDK